jgi:hypothetical protein
MNKLKILLSFLILSACVDNSLDETPNDKTYPIRLIVDSEEGGDLPTAEDYALEIAFADHTDPLGDETITLAYEISEAEDDMEGVVSIDKIIYEVEIDECVFERELEFTPADDGLSGTITIGVDPDVGSLPESFEIVFVLPGLEDTEGKFNFALTQLSGSDRIILGQPAIFEYEVLDNDVAGEWELELETEEAFEAFKEVLGSLSNDLNNLSFEDITGKVTAEFEYGEMKFVVELSEEEEVTVCEDGETETETVNKEIEIEAEYEAEDGALTLEGSHFIVGDDGDIENELDFIVESEYGFDLPENLSINFKKVMDEDNFKSGEELFSDETGITFLFIKN